MSISPRENENAGDPHLTKQNPQQNKAMQQKFRRREVKAKTKEVKIYWGKNEKKNQALVVERKSFCIIQHLNMNANKAFTIARCSIFHFITKARISK